MLGRRSVLAPFLDAVDQAEERDEPDDDGYKGNVLEELRHLWRPMVLGSHLNHTPRRSRAS